MPVRQHTPLHYLCTSITCIIVSVIHQVQCVFCKATTDEEHSWHLNRLQIFKNMVYSLWNEKQHLNWHDLWLASYDFKSLGATARSTWVRKTCPRPDPTDTLSLGNRRLTELRVLKTEYPFLGTTQGRPEQESAQNTINLSNKHSSYLSQASFAPDIALKNSDLSMLLVPPEQPRY